MKKIIAAAALVLACGGTVKQCPGEGVVVSKVVELTGGVGNCDAAILFEYTVGSEAVEAEELFQYLEDAGHTCAIVESGDTCAPFVTMNCEGWGVETQLDWDFQNQTFNYSTIGGGLHTECWYE